MLSFFLRNIVYHERLKKLHELWNYFKKKNKKCAVDKLKFSSAVSCNNAEKDPWLIISEILFSPISSSQSVCNSDKGIIPVVSQTAIANTLDSNVILQRPVLEHMFDHTFIHILYFSHPTFLSHKSLIVWNYEEDSGKNFKWEFSNGLSIINVNTVIKDFNSFDYIMSKNWSNFNKSYEKEKKEKTNLIKMTTVNKACSNSALMPKNLKQQDKKLCNKLTMKKFLAKLLNLDEDKISSSISRHPMKFPVSSKQIKETYNFLLENNYSLDLIKDCVIIILYPKKRVEETLKFLHSSKVIEKDSERKYVLQLCVYYMEKPFRFSGHGMIQSEDLEKS